MQVQKIDFPRPILCIDNFLPDEEAKSILDEAISVSEKYERAKSSYGTGNPTVNEEVRKHASYALSDDPKKTESDIFSILSERFFEGRLTDLCKQVPLFSIIPKTSSLQVIVNRWGSGDFFVWHAGQPSCKTLE